MKNDEFGDRMKFYERQFTSQKFTPLLPIVVRLDGRCFSKLTKNFDKPFDENFRENMGHVMLDLVLETNARIGFTQSDEITLILDSSSWKSEVYFNGKIQKIISILAALASVQFNEYMQLQDRIALFDCRAFTVPNKIEAANALLWRVQDAVRNSILAVGQHFFSHKRLMNKNTSQIQEMLWQEHKINWNDYPAKYKEGIFVQRKKVMRKFEDFEINKLPKNHEARKNPDLMVERNMIDFIQLSPFKKVKNKVEVIFDGADPIFEEESSLIHHQV